MKNLASMSLRLLLAFNLILSLVPTASAAARNRCEALFDTKATKNLKLESLSDKAAALETNPATLPVIKSALQLAAKNKWPVKLMDVGPAQRKLTRVFIGVDVENAADMQTYRDAFLPTLALGQENAGTLPLEYAHEPKTGIGYVFGFLRVGAKDTDLVVRQNQPATTYTEALNYFNNYTPREPISHYANLIGINKSEAENFQVYLNNPKLRAPVKNENCIAWSSAIELGVTKVGATTDERQHLFPELGMSRSYDPKEISARFVHAANERHRVIFVFYRGSKEGLKAFNDLENNVTVEPKIPYTSIIKNLPVDTTQLRQAMSVIPDGAKVFFPIAAGASPEGMQGLMEYAKGLDKGIDIHLLVNGISEASLRKGLEAGNGKVRLHALFLGGNLRQLNKEGKVNVIPGYLADFPRMVKNGKSEFAYDAIIVRVSPPDQNGNHSFGANNDMIDTILKSRPDIKIIAEVNKNVPYVPNGLFINKDKIASTFVSDAPLAGPVTLPTTEIEASIGDKLGKLIPSGATLQIGIGNIFGGLPAGFAKEDVRNIKIWTEMFGDPMKDLMEAGRVDSAVTGFAFGSTQLYKWLDKNNRVQIKSTIEVNNPGYVSEVKAFHAVNTALQVNLRGDVNATHGPEGRISSPGGQVEFMTGAARSHEGKAIIAIRSTAKNGEISAITMDNYHGSVTTPHESVTHVVTEYGIAELVGKSERERALSLIRIAHPKFRLMLASEAVKRNMISENDKQTIAAENL